MIWIFSIFFAVMAVISAIAMVSHKNTVYSAVFLVLTFFSIAALYFILEAQFLGVVQIIVYAGAIMVLFLFVIMLLNLRAEARLPLNRPFQIVFGIAFALVLLIQVAMFLNAGLKIAQVGSYPPEVINRVGSVETLGMALFSKYLYPFEIASLLLLVGIVGAIILGRKKMPKEF